MKLRICEYCSPDKTVLCKRDANARCMHCGRVYCGGHISRHLESAHCVAIDNEHRSTQPPAVPHPDTKRDVHRAACARER